MEKFNSSFNGYNRKEVNAFVDEMAQKYSDLLNKLKERDIRIHNLEEQNNILKEQIENYKKLSTLISTDSQVTEVARNEAKRIIEDARIEASKIVNEALANAEKEEKKATQMRSNITVFKKQVRDTVQSQLQIIDEIDEIKLDE